MKANRFARDEDAQVGIGTMIVFIATILVAAVAAGVLVGVGSDLQSQSQATSAEARDEVSNQLTIRGLWARDVTNPGPATAALDEEAVDENGDDDEADEILIAVTPAAGSDAFDLREMEIIINDGSSVNTFVYFDHGAGEETDATTGETADGLEPASPGFYFALETQGAGDRNSDTELNDGEVIIIRILGEYVNPTGAAGAGTFGDRLNIAPGSSPTMTIIPPNGASKIIELSMPNVMDEDIETLPF